MLAAKHHELDAVVELEVDDALMVERISGRFTCSKCGTGYHDHFKPTAVPGVCDACGSHAFTRRPDDKRETVAARLAAYHGQTAPLLPYFRARGRLRAVNGMADIGEVTAQLIGVLDGVRSELVASQ